MHISLPECTLLVHLAWVQCCECHREPQPPLTRPLHHSAGSRPSARLGAISKTNLQPKPASPCLSLLLSSSIPTNQPTNQPTNPKPNQTNQQTKPNQPGKPISIFLVSLFFPLSRIAFAFFEQTLTGLGLLLEL